MSIFFVLFISLLVEYKKPSDFGAVEGTWLNMVNFVFVREEKESFHAAPVWKISFQRRDLSPLIYFLSLEISSASRRRSDNNNNNNNAIVIIIINDDSSSVYKNQQQPIQRPPVNVSCVRSFYVYLFFFCREASVMQVKCPYLSHRPWVWCTSLPFG